MFQYLKGGYKEDGDSLFTRSHMEKTRGNRYKLLPGRFQLDTRGKLFTMRTISHWNNLPREVVYSPTLDTFKIWLDRDVAEPNWQPAHDSRCYGGFAASSCGHAVETQTNCTFGTRSDPREK
ncbi:hypothetical protein QYF61_022311 [Mycteria americana]|uniref:Uncharacterized protein n=1 Tax=Mycteria americana TaxID=33587 RepID=A0AAN7PLD4_MYCAM|nr:hypothetical protein QYF61_022311 [Mycteria americana]